MGKYVIGVDYGSASVRAAVVDALDGSELAHGIYEYEYGVDGNYLDKANAHVVRQNPDDYLRGMEVSVRRALENAGADFDANEVVGIGVDATGTTVLPVSRTGVPICQKARFKGNPNAMIWLWKDHSSTAEAQIITQTAKAMNPEYVDMVGGTYSSEWYWAKVLHCLNCDPDVFDAAYTWIEVSDWLVFLLTGGGDIDHAVRGICAASHKALFNPEWGGFPSEDFIEALDPRLTKLLQTLDEDMVRDVSAPAGRLCREWAERMGLPLNIVVSVPGFDAHFGGIGAGIKPGILVKTIGTSTCDLYVLKKTGDRPSIKGMAGIVHDSILPGYYGIEAGQSAVGDILNWFVEYVAPAGKSHNQLTEEAALLKPGQSGLVSLDWNNGNRTVLIDQRLTGLIIGLTLQSSGAEIYRALIEGTAFGARVIQDRMEEGGLAIDKVVVCGGIPRKSKLFMQIYADVLGKTLYVSKNAETCALGGAIAAAVNAGVYPSFEEAIAHMTNVMDACYEPIPENAAVYERLFKIYLKLHDGFGIPRPCDFFSVMKDLLAIKEEQRKP